MFRIGEFSKLSQVSVKTLRYYGQIGLLLPAEVNRFTSYRYYTTDQLHRLNRILALKDLGLSLDQISLVLDHDLSPAELRGMLRLKQVELEQQVEEQQARLGRVAARLRQIEQEGKMPTYEVTLKEVPAQRIASVRDVVANYPAQGALWNELAAFMKQHQVKAVGPCFTIDHETEFKESDIALEVCEPIDIDLEGNERVSIRELPGGQMASMMHVGPYDTLSEAYPVLIAWIKQNGYRIVDSGREIYIRNMADHGVEPADYVTEIQFPVMKA